MPWAQWCGPQVNAIATHAAPKCENPIVSRFRIISVRVMIP
jgi:hypothetical protein